MARQQKLKVFRTPIGFHDAYVAAPSRKAALRAWGSDADLFARGVAEEVQDAALMEAPLASPGTVVRRLRGTEAEQFAALPPDRPRPARPRADADPPSTAKAAGTTAKRAPAAPPAPRPAPPPRPSRAPLDRAQAALDALDEAQRAEEEDLRRRERALAQERRDLERRHERDRRHAVRARDEAQDAHRAALDRWMDRTGQAAET